MTSPPKPEEDKMSGRELEILDGLLPVLYQKARAGNAQAVEQVLRVLEMRLRFQKHKRSGG